VVDQLIAMLTWIVGRTRSPTAYDEVKVLDREQPPQEANLAGTQNDAAVIDAVATFAFDRGLGVTNEEGSLLNLGKLRQSILQAAEEGALGTSGAPLSEPEARAVAEKAYRSKYDLGLLLRWFALFTRYRHDLAEQLARDHANQPSTRFQAVLICPALIDYDFWLGEYVHRSPLPAQVTVMGRIAKRKTGPAVHGYVGFDPLRQVAFDSGTFKEYEPLALVRKAIREEGFLGVKLYSPMGYRPLGNGDRCQTYPHIASIRKLLAGSSNDPQTAGCKPRPADGSRMLGERLDAAMVRLFETCVREDAAVIAHTNDSNSAGENYSKRADPAYWIDVFKRWPTLRVGLAHFGSFSAESVGRPPGASGEAATWEWTIGRFLQATPSAPVYADISYLVEIVGRSEPEGAKYAKTFEAWIYQFDPECRHLMFGTDWTMLGLDAAYEGYTDRVYRYFQTVLGFSAPMLHRLFGANAAAFLGLRENDSARKRLLAFYQRHGLPATRLPVF
jgi:predicted TIM-barrel fold metal-dependent hydrolase